MKVLDTIYLSPKDNCKTCLGKGFVLVIRPDLDATKFREAVSCPKCVRQVVRIEEDAKSVKQENR